jgi:polyisoprenyl-phosphate glycosyltransferase
MRDSLISLVVPCYNEQASLDALFARLDASLRTIPRCRFEILCVNDGSKDATLDKLIALAATRSDLVVIDLSRNFGKESALSAGLEAARGDAVIPIDADLQDPPSIIAPMVEAWRKGFEVVLAKREDRSEDTVAKRLSARWFYKINNLVADVALPEDVGDFRLMDRAVVDVLKSLPENRRFMKGLFAWVGFRTTVIGYKREARQAGQTSFNAWRLWNLALEGITSFSIAPLRVWTYVGALVAAAALAWGGWIALRTLVYGVDVPGYASIFVAVLFLGGLQLVGIGVIGEYLGRTYLESKRRPPYVVRKVYRCDA